MAQQKNNCSEYRLLISYFGHNLDEKPQPLPSLLGWLNLKMEWVALAR